MASVSPALPHRDPWQLFAVGLGGAIGAPLRYTVGLAVPAGSSGFPTGTLLINVLGCLLLGMLTEGVALGVRPDSWFGHYARPLLGSGVLGAFTTYSTFAVETDQLLSTGRAGVALTYVAVSLLLGGLAAVSGVHLARRALAGLE